MKKSIIAVLCTLVVMSGCMPKGDNPQAVREKAADATAAIKRDTKAIAQGVREGWNRDKPIDLNSASKEELQRLEGVTPKTADAIIAHRPYSNPNELVSKRILSKPAYDKIADRLKVQK